METDTAVKQAGVRGLEKQPDSVKEPFDYIEWRRTHLDQNMSIRELSAAAEEYAAKLHGKN